MADEFPYWKMTPVRRAARRNRLPIAGAPGRVHDLRATNHLGHAGELHTQTVSKVTGYNGWLLPQIWQ